MAFEERDMSGALFPNERKAQDNHPDYTGYVVIEGKKWSIAAWNKQGRSGEFYFLKASEPRSPVQSSESAPETKAPATRGIDDEIPF